MWSHLMPKRLLYCRTTVGVGRRPHSRRLLTRLSDSSQMTPSDVDSRGSTKPEALPMPTTFLTHDRSQRPVANFTACVACTFGFLARNSLSAMASDRKALE